MSQLGGQGPYRWGGVPPLFGRNVFSLARRMAAQGWDEQTIRTELTRIHGGQGGVRPQEIGRAASIGVTWYQAIHAHITLWPNAPILRDYASRAPGIPNTYRYTVNIEVDAANNEWRTVVVDSSSRLSWNQLRAQAAMVFASMQQDYRNIANLQVDQNNQMNIENVQRRT